MSTFIREFMKNRHQNICLIYDRTLFFDTVYEMTQIYKLFYKLFLPESQKSCFNLCVWIFSVILFFNFCL